MKRLLAFLLALIVCAQVNAAIVAASCGTGAADTLSLTKPTGTTTGDELLLAVSVAETVTVTTYTFTLVGDADSTGNAARANTTQFCRRRAGGSEPASYIVGIGGGNSQTFRACMVAVRGRVDETPAFVPTNDASFGASPEDIPLTGVTGVSGDDIVIFNVGEAVNTTGTWVVNSVPASYTNQATATDVGAFTGGFLNVTTRENVGSGATGTLTSQATYLTQLVDTYGIVVRLANAGGGGSSGLLRRRRGS
jgi:hypothetical protein